MMVVTRRQMLGGMAGILATGAAPAAVVRSALGARGVAMSGGGAWGNPYITDGLVAMWDGEWNIEPGKHDQSSPAWVDLIGGRKLAMNGSATFGEKFMVTTDHVSGAIGDFTIDDVKTVEIVFENDDDWVEWQSLIDDVSGFWVWSTRSEYYLFNYYNLPICFGNKISISFCEDFAYQNGNIYHPLEIYKEEGLGAFSIFGNYDNVGEERCVKGKCYSVRLYNRILSTNEVAANYAVDKARFNLT